MRYRIATISVAWAVALLATWAVPALAGLEVTSLGRLQPPLPARDEQGGTDRKWLRVQKDLGLDPDRVVIRQTACNLGGDTSVRNRKHLPWKEQGYYQRCRDLGQVFSVSEKPFTLDAIILRTGNGYLACEEGTAGAFVFVQFFEVTGTPRIDDNGTPPGTEAAHGFSKNHRCDDVLSGVTYRPIPTTTAGAMPDLRADGGDGRLTYITFDLTGDDEIWLEAGKRYAFLVGIAEPVDGGNFTLGHCNRASDPAPPRLADPGTYPGGWGIRREAGGKRPETVPGPNPPADEALRSRLERQSRFPPLAERLARAPTTEGYPDVDTYRDLEFYLVRTEKGTRAAWAADLALTILGISLGVVALIAGFGGCVLPVLPGPLIGFLSLLCLQFTGVHDYRLVTLLVLGVLAALVMVVDNVVALLGIQVTGGSKAALVGGGIGVVVGLFVFPPFGIIIGPLLGAILAELIVGNTAKRAFASGVGSLLGFLYGTFLKTVVTAVIAGFFIWGLVTGA